MIALSLLLAAAAAPMPDQSPGAVFSGLVGSCWEAQRPEGNSDTHCFTATAGGKLVMDVHKVRNAQKAVVYEGVTLYRNEGGAIRYDYYNSLGDLYPGYARGSGADFLFSDKPDAASTLTWRLSADGYDTIAGTSIIHFRKVGPAGDGL